MFLSTVPAESSLQASLPRCQTCECSQSEPPTLVNLATKSSWVTWSMTQEAKENLSLAPLQWVLDQQNP